MAEDDGGVNGAFTPHFNLFSLVLWPGIDPTSRMNIVQKRDATLPPDSEITMPASPGYSGSLAWRLFEPARFAPSSLPEMSRLAQLTCCPELSFATLHEEPGRSKQRTECRACAFKFIMCAC